MSRYSGKVLQHRQNRGQRPLRRGDVVRPARIADGHMRPHQRRNPLRARHHRQHQPHAAQMRPGKHGPIRIGIRNPHIDLDLVVRRIRDRESARLLRGSRAKTLPAVSLDIQLASYGLGRPIEREGLALHAIAAVVRPHLFPSPPNCEKIQPRIALMRLKVQQDVFPAAARGQAARGAGGELRTSSPGSIGAC